MNDYLTHAEKEGEETFLCLWKSFIGNFEDKWDDSCPDKLWCHTRRIIADLANQQID